MNETSGGAASGAARLASVASRGIDLPSVAETKIKPLAGSPRGNTLPPPIPIERDIARIQDEYVYGEIWSRESLPLVTRSLVGIGILATTSDRDALQYEITQALNIGISTDEIIEVIAHAAIFGGIAFAENALNVASVVFSDTGRAQVETTPEDAS